MINMKTLIRKHGFTPTTEAQDEIFPELSWPDWVKADGFPLTEENYGYALCENCPENVSDLDVNDFAVTSETYVDADENGEQRERTRWMAVYVGRENAPATNRMKEIEELKKKLAVLESDL